LGRCFVFVDEADQVLGRRDAAGNDGGLSGRIYSMFATEMSNPANRGKVVWVLATSRPDLVEVDLKRPGRIDVKVPIFPTTTAREAFDLLRALCRRREVEIAEGDFAEIEPLLPGLLTPGAADALAVKIYRVAKLEGLGPVAAVRRCLEGYQHPVPMAVLEAQIRLAVAEASDMEFVPEVFR
jgi:SpoVK/Ycf46/Vps4 family AAA+-type ATPase